MMALLVTWLDFCDCSCLKRPRRTALSAPAKSTMAAVVANRSPLLAFSIQIRLQSGHNRSEIDESKRCPPHQRFIASEPGFTQLWISTINRPAEFVGLSALTTTLISLSPCWSFILVKIRTAFSQLLSSLFHHPRPILDHSCPFFSPPSPLILSSSFSSSFLEHTQIKTSRLVKES